MQRQILFNIREEQIPPLNIQRGVAIITGGTSGIGAETAKMFTLSGFDTYILGKSKTRMEKVVNNILLNRESCSKFGSISGLEVDVRKESQVTKVFENIFNNYKEGEYFPILVTSAGHINPSPIISTTLNSWKKQIDVNLTGTFLCIREFVKYNKIGQIFTISSSSAFKGRPGWGAYCASKAGVVNLMETVQEEFPDLFICDIAPSRVATPMRKKLFPTESQEEMNTPEDIADLIKYLIVIRASGLSYWVKDGMVTTWK